MQRAEAPCTRSKATGCITLRQRAHVRLSRPQNSWRAAVCRTTCAASRKGQQQTAEGARARDSSNSAGPSSGSTTLVQTAHLHA